MSTSKTIPMIYIATTSPPTMKAIGIIGSFSFSCCLRKGWITHQNSNKQKQDFENSHYKTFRTLLPQDTIIYMYIIASYPIKFYIKNQQLGHISHCKRTTFFGNKQLLRVKTLLIFIILQSICKERTSSNIHLTRL